ncbi:MAG TPA: S53 family peptidase [Candidatus Limnocylindrales bacterium]|nr:S53 family peptidase [Candidatus Limnocylindrales bacterium]
MKITKAILYFAVISLAGVLASAQTSSVPSRIKQAIDNSQRTTLRGNTYPMARPEFDRGAAAATMPMEHLLLVLKRSPAQEAALEDLMAQQLDETSANYHKWLTPEEFGARFGPSDQDIQAVARWLFSQGLGVSQIAPGRTTIEFSGTAANVQRAFNTEIHMYDVRGKQHWANSSDPQIPTALTPVVAGVEALHDFKPQPMSHRVSTLSRPNASAGVQRVKPLFTYPSGCSSSACNFALGPADIATIYNITALWNAGFTGSGQKIAVLGQSAVNLADMASFRQMFGVTPASNPPTVISVPGHAPPALGQDTGDEGESDLDLQWAGSIAPQATVIFVTSSGVDFSASYAVNNNTAPVIGLSYGLCEAELLSTGNQFWNSTWQQAAAEGITVSVSSGDTDAAGCEPSNTGSSEQPATTGLAVSGLSSTPYNVAVGGTDFNDPTNPTTYFNTSNTGSTQVSAKSYIPETTYNDSCSNAVWALFGWSNIPLANCNSAVTSFQPFISPIGGGGGPSGVYPKPSWQAGPGVPDDATRDVPDLSLFAGDGFMGSFYIACQSDQTSNVCNLNSPYTNFLGFGGTSASTQVFAGIMALVNQKNSPSAGQGLVNAKLYELAAQQSGTNCNSSSPASTCTFNDVTVGTISAPCLAGTSNCSVTASGEPNGILSGCDAGAGYDMATGLGSINVDNLANNWSTAVPGTTADFQLSMQNCNATVNVASPGSSGSINATVTEVNGFSGSLSPTCAGLPTLASCTFSQSTTDATHISLTVTVSTASTGDVAPISRPKWPAGFPLNLAIALTLIIFVVAVMRLRGGRRWAAGFALAALTVVLVSCGGGGSSFNGGGGGGGSGGTPTGFVSGATLTVTSGSTTHTMPFNVNVE